jgi:TIR domain
MAEPDAARELYRIIQQHVRGDGTKKSAYAKQRQALRKKVGGPQMPGCVRRHATLGRCNAYLRQHAGEAVRKRLDLVKREFEPLLATPTSAKSDTLLPKPAVVPALAVFISHSSRDHKLAEAIVDLLRAALGLKREAIRCTSVPGYQLPGGANVDTNIRRETVAARVFIALVTPASLRSTYVLFELGARWGIELENSLLIPLVAGIVARDVPAPLSSLNLVDASKQDSMHEFLDQVGKALNVEVRRAVDYVRELGRATELAGNAQPKLSKYEQRVVRALFGEEKGRRLSRYVDDPLYQKAVAELQGRGLVERNDKRYVLTESGKDVARNLVQPL